MSHYFTLTAPTGDDMLQPDDAVNILEELLDAQNHSFELGLKLKLPLRDVKAICARFSEPRKQLLYIIIAFLEQANPRPTWRVLVDALRSNAVNLTALARRVEAAHFPDLTATSEITGEFSLSVPVTLISDTEPAVDLDNDEVEPKPTIPSG